MTRTLVHLTLTAKEAETVMALLDQEADGLEEDKCLNAKLVRRRARYLRNIAKKIEPAGAAVDGFP